MSDVVGSPAALATQPHHLTANRPHCPVRRTPRPARTIQQTSVAFDKEPVTPLADRLGVDLEPISGRLDRPALLKHALDHVAPMPRGQPRVGMLPSSVGHEPSRVWGELSETHSLTRRAHLTGG